MASEAQKQEIVHEATHRAKSAVEGAQAQVKDYMMELKSIEGQLSAVRQQNVAPDRTQIEALEARLKGIQEDMASSVEAASKEVGEATSSAKSQLGMEGTAGPKAQVSRPGSADIERQDTGAQDVLAPATLTDKYAAMSPRPSPASSAQAIPHPATQARSNSGEDTGTPPSARASQGIVGGFGFHSGGSGESDEEEPEGPTADDVTASMDEASDSVNTAAASNKAVVEDVRDKLEQHSLGK